VQQPYTAQELEHALEVRLVDPELEACSRLGPLVAPAQKLAGLARAQQEFLLRCVARVAHVHEQIAYQFALCAVQALQTLGEEGVEAWLASFMGVYDRTGLYPALQALRDLDHFAAEQRALADGVALREVEGILAAFIHGLAGRPLRILPGMATYTDTETLFLPKVLAVFSGREQNFRLYKATAAHLWAQTWFGTFTPEVFATLAAHPQPEQALAIFHALETERLDACLCRELPGLYREMAQLRDHAGLPDARDRLTSPLASVADSLELLAGWHQAELPTPFCYQGQLLLNQVQRVRDERLARDRNTLIYLLTDLAQQATPPATPPPSMPVPEFHLEINRQCPSQMRIFLDGQPLRPPVVLRETVQSILQDLGEIPPEWLQAAGPGGYAGGRREGVDKLSSASALEAETYQYDEWNYQRAIYHRNWCTLREISITPVSTDFFHATLRQYAPLVKHLRRTFEVFRAGEKRLKRQQVGDEVDMDAVVQALADASTGQEMTSRLFMRIHKTERDVATVFLVDMSGSTKGWINDAERESLILLCEALETLGDRYAIYGFSGMTRIRCEIYPIKTLREPYSEAVQGRICAITPKDYTRMGAAIRHVTKILTETEARTKLLITLSDGKPDDFDSYYRGDYGLEDTRHALQDAKNLGIRPFCITIDKEGQEYLPRLYGAVNYTVLSHVRQLPWKAAEIYRVLTTK